MDDRKRWQTDEKYWDDLLVEKGREGCNICGLRYMGQLGHGPPCYGHEQPKDKDGK